ncbi:TPA: Panacea domain-containing protein [Staphylococcus aureus]
MISINEVAKYFIENGEDITPKKLQKLSYYAEAWCNALLNERLIEDTHFEAWVHGPVSPDLYQQYKKYGWNEIDKPEVNVEYSFSDKEKEILDSVIETYGHLSGNELEALTHEETPWLNQRKGLGETETPNNIIKFEDMQSYYSSIYLGD